MIKSFKHKGLKAFFETGSTAGILVAHKAKIRNCLMLIDSSKTIEDLDFPYLRLHALKGKLEGLWSIRVSGNWRIVFRFEEGHTYVVEYKDYH